MICSIIHTPPEPHDYTSIPIHLVKVNSGMSDGILINYHGTVFTLLCSEPTQKMKWVDAIDCLNHTNYRIPTLDEWNIINELRNDINNLLEENGYPQISDDKEYWTSETNNIWSELAYSYIVHKGKFTPNTKKTEELSIRLVC